MAVVDLTEIEMEIPKVLKEYHRGTPCLFKIRPIHRPDGSKIYILANENESVFVDAKTYNESKLPNY